MTKYKIKHRSKKHKDYHKRERLVKLFGIKAREMNLIDGNNSSPDKKFIIDIDDALPSDFVKYVGKRVSTIGVLEQDRLWVYFFAGSGQINAI